MSLNYYSFIFIFNLLLCRLTFSNGDLSEHWRELKNHFQAESNTPPYGHGMIINGHQIVTFDQALFEIDPSNCTYLLSEGCPDTSVKVFFSGRKKLRSFEKSILINSFNLSIRINLGKNLVKINNWNRELPFIHRSVIILRNTFSVSLIFSPNLPHHKDLAIECLLQYDLCFFSVSHKCLNKTKGLLGNYDKISSNDMVKTESKREKVDDLSLLYNGTCKEPARSSSQEKKEGQKTHRLCRKLCSDISQQLGPGFDVVFDSEKCLQSCANLVKLTRKYQRPEKTVCTLAAAYVHSLQQNSIDVLPPLSCLKCEKGLRFGARKKITPFGDSLMSDFVFVVQEAPCLGNVVENLAGLAKNLEILTLENGLDPRFGLISFGILNGMKQNYRHTINGNLLFEADSMGVAVDCLNLARSGGKKGDILEALAAASQYPFRLGSAKNLILMTCDHCQNTADSRFDYNDIRAILLSDGIVLHIVNGQFVSLITLSPKLPPISAIDGDLVHFKEEFNLTKLEIGNLREKISIPSDICIVLAHISGGSYIPVNSMENLGLKWQKMTAQRVSSATKAYQCQLCDCILSEDLIQSRTICKPCNSYETKA